MVRDRSPSISIIAAFVLACDKANPEPKLLAPTSWRLHCRLLFNQWPELLAGRVACSMSVSFPACRVRRTMSKVQFLRQAAVVWSGACFLLICRCAVRARVARFNVSTIHKHRNQLLRQSRDTPSRHRVAQRVCTFAIASVLLGKAVLCRRSVPPAHPDITDPRSTDKVQRT